MHESSPRPTYFVLPDDLRSAFVFNFGFVVSCLPFFAALSFFDFLFLFFANATFYL